MSFLLRSPTPCAAAKRLPEVVVKNPVLRATKEQTSFLQPNEKTTRLGGLRLARVTDLGADHRSQSQDLSVEGNFQC